MMQNSQLFSQATQEVEKGDPFHSLYIERLKDLFSNSASILVPIHVSYNVSRLKTIRVRAVSETVRAYSRGFAEARTMLSRRTQKFLERSRRCEAAIRRKKQDRKQVL